LVDADPAFSKGAMVSINGPLEDNVIIHKKKGYVSLRGCSFPTLAPHCVCCSAGEQSPPKLVCFFNHPEPLAAFACFKDRYGFRKVAVTVEIQSNQTAENAKSTKSKDFLAVLRELSGSMALCDINLRKLCNDRKVKSTKVQFCAIL
jgi:hypothetical protein